MKELSSEQKEQLLARMRLWAYDKRAYSRDLLKVQSTTGGLVPLNLNVAQQLFFDIIDDIRAKGRLVRIVVLKARRFGISTATAARFFHGVAMRKNRYAIVVCHEPDSAEFIFNMYRRYFYSLPDPMKPATKYNSIRKLEFNKPNGQGLDSAISVAAAGKENIGSGQLSHFCHLSEMSKWPSHTADAIMTSIMQTVPREPETEVIIESTAKGIGNLFHEKFTSARYQYTAYLDENKKPQFKCEVNPDTVEENDWSSIFLPWFIFPDYSIKVPGGFTTTEEEKKLQVAHNLTIQQLAWRRWAIASNCNGSEQIFFQEFPSTSLEAFLSSGSPVFDTFKILEEMKAAAPPIVRYNHQFGTGNFLADPNGQLQVWEEPKPTSHYIISADIAEGIEVSSDDDEQQKYDNTVCDVFDHLTGKQVAHFCGKMPPDVFAHFLFHLGRRYNTAWLVPERNNTGLGVVTKLFELRYPKIYVEKVPEPPGKPRKRYGWLTSRSTKPMIIHNLDAELREGTLGIRCRETLKEMLSFKRNPDGTMEAEKNMKDDRVLSAAIGKFVRTKLPLPSGTMKRPTDFFIPTQQSAPPPSTKGYL